MMNEYNLDNSNENENKKTNKHIGTKIIAGLMAMTLVSGGSIFAYREIAGESDTNTKEKIVYVNGDDKDKDIEEEGEKLASIISADAMSLIETEKKASGVELTTEEIVEKVLPSVVGIESEFTITSSGNSGFYFGDEMPFGDFGGFSPFGGFGSGSGQSSESTATATGTGVVITENGYIVTNAHVIYDTEYNGGLAKSISVLMNDDETYDAEVIGYDTDCDIAVLKIKATGLTAAEFGNSSDLHLGESVVAIGNPLGFELMDTVTGGMISGLNREITINDKAMTLIQTDAAINSGNSGGPLINRYGQVIGINSSKMSSSYGSASIEGIGFAIPSDEVSKIVDDIMKYGYVTGKPQLGISCQDVTETISQMYNLPVGVYVTDVTEGSAADIAGLESGDVITEIDGKEVSTSEELTAEKNKHSAGDKVKITYIRSGKERHTEITLDEAKKED